MTETGGRTGANPITVALDMPRREAALAMVARLGGTVGGLKVGLEFVAGEGPDGVRALVATGMPVFLDVKLHDIPNTVAGAVRTYAGLGIAMLNVHATGGLAMMQAAKEAAAGRCAVIAVTVLTSLDAGDLKATGVAGAAAEQALRLAVLAQEAGLDGVVCSAHEAPAIRRACGPAFRIVVPGLRPAGAALGDQKRVMTPREALKAGADMLVIGRPIIEAADPAAAARAIAESLA